ncbi:MAG TPA: ABC transporter ATP-binding protein [Candidatus Faecousia intestinigallinarum]|nr:ABC transporter ATP-binding protein [Candidatus Faecousia intestinigallinarum]
MEAIVEFSHITMDFPGVRANDDVSLSIRRGEIFALVGENGAGKSTLMNILYGIHTPTAGSVTIHGKPVVRFDPKAAIAAGVGMVHQHFMLVPSFTVTENIVLSREPRKGIFCDRREARRQVEALSREYGLEVEPDSRVRDLSVGQQQRVEILKTLYRGAEILILDEPTAVLTPQETNELFTVLRRVVRERGMTVILITHKLYEVAAVSQRVGVMRRGRLVGVADTASVSQRQLAGMMVGREMQPTAPRQPLRLGEEKVHIQNLCVANSRGLPAVRDLSLTLRAGEILGIAAVEGNGQSELLEAIAGMRPFQGEIQVNGRSIRGLSPGQVRSLGLAHVPEDRLRTGVDPEASVAENLVAGRHRAPRFARFGVHLRKKAIREYAEGLYRAFDIRGAGADTEAGSLSGGNMQKTVIAREMSAGAEVLLIAQPTRGVDIGAVEFIHSQILAQRDGGAAILLSSADLDEILTLSDRIITLYEGRVTGEYTGEFSKTELGLGMTGGGKEATHEA